MISIARSIAAGLVFACLASFAVLHASAQAQTRSEQALLASADGRVQINNISSAALPAEASRGVQSCVDMTGVDSWDGLDDADNAIVDINISSSLKVVGVAWDVGISSIGDSWLADASVFVSNSDGTGDPNAIILTPGFAVEAPGDQEFSSGGIITFADESLPDIEPNADGLVRLQFYETFDDVPDAIDSEWRNAASPVTCPGIWLELDDAQSPGGPGIPPETDPSSVPLDQPVALALLVMLLAAVGIRFLAGRA